MRMKRFDLPTPVKRDVSNATSCATEMVAFAHAEGGTLTIGVKDDGTVPGLTSAGIRRLHLLAPTPSNVLTRSRADLRAWIGGVCGGGVAPGHTWHQAPVGSGIFRAKARPFPCVFTAKSAPYDRISCCLAPHAIRRRK